MLKKMITASVMTFLICAFYVCTSWALPFQVDFSVTGFESAAPYAQVSGSIAYEASAIDSTIDSLTAINLIIGSMNYSLSDVDFKSGSQSLIYGSLNGTPIRGGTDDFWLRWDTSSMSPLEFVYSSSGTEGFWKSQNFDSFTIASSAPIPEPSTIILLGAGIIGLAVCRRKAKK